MKNGNHLRAIMLFACTLAWAFFLLPGCGDELGPPSPRPDMVQGVWEGTLEVAAAANGLEVSQTTRIRLELIQQDLLFEGLLLQSDPLAFGPAVRVDTFLVAQGTLSAGTVSFRALAPGDGEMLFNGALAGRQISGTVISTGCTGVWSVEFRH